MKNSIWLKMDLQRFAGEGGGGTGGEGAATGVNGSAAAGQTSGVNDASAVAGQKDRLLELGVPAAKVERFHKSRARKEKTAQLPASTGEQKSHGEQASKQQVAAASGTDEGTANEAAPKTGKASWDELMADPDYNKEMQRTVSAAVNAKKNEGTAALEAMGKLAPALEVLARKYGLDPQNVDHAALAKAVSDDSAYYEEKALAMGVPVETAMQLDQKERDTLRQKKEAERTLEQQKMQNHIISLREQGEKMKEKFPNFDLRTELQNPHFARMTHPNVGISVEDAYYAVHRQEIQAAAMQATAQKTAEQISNAIRSGSHRPVEGGASSQASSVPSFDYRNMTPDERKQFKNNLRRNGTLPLRNG